MTAQSAATAAYIVASLLFILSLAGLSKHETSRNGVLYGIAGMGIALVATFVLVADVADADAIALLLVAVVIGAALGLWRARIVAMTQMPELIALLHSFVGLAAVLVGWNGYLAPNHLTGSLADIHHAEIFIGIFIGPLVMAAGYSIVMGWLSEDDGAQGSRAPD